MTLVATFDATDSRVQLAGSSIPSVSGMGIQIDRRVNGGDWEGVRGASPTYESGGTVQVDDYEFTPNVLNEYRISTAFIYDNFGRSSASSWGSANSGQAYTVSGGAGSDYNVSGGNGRMLYTTLNVLRTATLATTSVADFDFYTDVGLTQNLALGAPLHIYLVGRRQDASNYYFLDVAFLTTGLIQLNMYKRTGGVDTLLGTYNTGLSYTSGINYRVHFRALGNRLSAKLYGVSADEPGLYYLNVLDNSISAAGQIGVASLAETGNTNPASPSAQFDNLHVHDLATLNPQLSNLGTDDVTPDQDTVWLKFPLRPFLNREVTLCNWGEETIQQRGAVFTVLGRRLPVATNDVRGSRQFEVILAAADVIEAENIRYSLSFGDTVFLQTPGPTVYCALARRAFPEQGYFYWDETTYTRVLDGVATMTISAELQEVAAPDATLEATSSTWQGIINAFATWQDVINSFADWNAVMAYLSSPTDEEIG